MSTTTTHNRLQATQNTYEEHVMRTYARYPVVFERGEGVYLWDTDGRRYLDFLSGIAVNGVGHCHPRVVQAVQQQAEKLLHVSNLYYIEQQAELASILCRLSGMDRAFFANSGAEANEAALKIARKLGSSRSDRKTGIIAAESSFHGRTLGTLAVTGQEKYQKPYRPLIGDVSIVPFNDIDALSAAVTADTCAIILEPIQGEGGVRPASQEYLEKARALADANQALLIFDEVQTGCGRTGNYYAFQGYGVTPDILTTAKAMGGGFPIGACLARGEAADVFQPGDHGTTYGGGPLACAASVAALRALEEDRLEQNASTMGAILQEKLLGLCMTWGHREVRGRGLMLALVLNNGKAREIVQAAFDNGLIINAIGPDVIRFLPPLIINEQHIQECINTLEDCIQKAGA